MFGEGCGGELCGVAASFVLDGVLELGVAVDLFAEFSDAFGFVRAADECVYTNVGISGRETGHAWRIGHRSGLDVVFTGQDLLKIGSLGACRR